MQVVKNTVIASVLHKQKQEAIFLMRLLHSFFVRNDVKLFLISIFLTFSAQVFAQESNKKKVLVVPYNRFEFVSEFELSEIAEKNNISSNEVFLLYQKTMLEAFENYQDENFEFVSVKHNLIKPYKNLIEYKNGKFRGKRYNAVDLSGFTENDFTKLLESHGCDFVVFLTWHDIQKESYTNSGRQGKRVDYAGHYLDYDVFNLFKQRVVGEGRIKAKVKPVNDLEASFALLRTTELTGAYQHFIAHIVEQLNNPIQ